jgi:hypothetical protein
MPQCQFPVFYYFCVSEKIHRKYSRNWTKQAKPSIFAEASRSPKMRRRGARSQAHPRAPRPSPWPHHQGVRPAGPPSDASLSPIYSPRREKPKGHIAFHQNILQAAAVIVARSVGSRSSSWHPAGEGNPYRRPSPPPWSPPEWCVSSLSWTTCP